VGDEAMRRSALCLLYDDVPLQRTLENILAGVFNLHFCGTRPEAIALLNQQPIVCILTDLYLHRKCTLPDIALLRRLFQRIPLVVFSKHREPELIRLCGKLGVERYVHYDERDQLLEIVQSIIDKHSFKVELEKYGISIESCPLWVKWALKYMAEHFLEIKTVKEISDHFNITLCHFDREFTAACGIAPKELLLVFKLHHATYLMESEGLNLKEVAYRVNFTDEFQFYRTFSQKMGLTASEYRKLYTSQDFLKIYHKKQKK